MKTSWKIARVAGIGIYLHVTFPLLLIAIALGDYQRNTRWDVFITDMVFIVALFSIVVLHELGHALTARRYGIRTHDITLLPIGGVAHLERIPDAPREELAVALAGPAVNAVLAGIFFGLVFVMSGESAFSLSNLLRGGLIERLLWANVAMAVFNLIPAFPMDGGRVLRALLALRLDYVQATNIAARIGQSLAVAAGVIGLFTNPFLVLIAVFVWMGAAQEAGMIRLKSSLADVPVGRITVSPVEMLAANMPIEAAAARMLATYQPAFPVVENDALQGMVTRNDLLLGLTRPGQTTTVKDIMRATPHTATADEKVGEVLSRLQENEPILPVLDGGRVIGLLGLANVVEYVRLHEARHREQRSGAAKHPPAPRIVPIG